MYYENSPGLADVIAKNNSLKVMTRWGLVPAVGMAYVAIHMSVMEKAGVAAGMLLLHIACYVMKRRRMRSVLGGQL
jgi:hypothetical protein